MRAIDLAVKDLRQLLRDWKTALFLVAMPVVFTLLFGFAFGGFATGESDPRLPVGYLARDEGPASQGLRDLLEQSSAVRPVAAARSGEERLERQVRDGDLAAAVVVPTGYSDALLAGEPVQLDVVAGDGVAAQTALGEIRAAAARLAGAAKAAQLATGAYEDQARLFPSRVTPFADGAARQAFLRAAFHQALLAWQEPALSVAVREGVALPLGEVSDRAIMQSGFSHTSPSMMVQFSIAGLIGAASLLVQERKTRALRRLLTTPIARAEIILGHYLAMFVLILAQLTILVAFGQVLRVPYLREPGAIALVMVTTAMWTAALGLLIGTLAKNEEQSILFSLVPMFVLAGMGGAWVPLEFTGRTFQAIGHALPSAWAMDGFENIVIRGLGPESALLPAAVMAGYAVVLFALAAWRFRFE